MTIITYPALWAPSCLNLLDVKYLELVVIRRQDWTTFQENQISWQEFYEVKHVQRHWRKGGKGVTVVQV